MLHNYKKIHGDDKIDWMKMRKSVLMNGGDESLKKKKVVPVKKSLTTTKEFFSLFLSRQRRWKCNFFFVLKRFFSKNSIIYIKQRSQAVWDREEKERKKKFHYSRECSKIWRHNKKKYYEKLWKTSSSIYSWELYSKLFALTWLWKEEEKIL